MKTTLLRLVSLLAFVAPLAASASDLANDLRTPFAPLTNPFGGARTMPLPAPTASALKALLESCAFISVSQRSTIALYREAALQARCQDALTPSYRLDRNGQRILGPVLKVQTGGLALQVVSWDGNDSDGGDEQALGIYDAAGNRIAVYTGVFADGNVLDGLSRVVGASLPKVIE